MSTGILFGKTRKAVLSLLYGHPDEEHYLRQIVRLTGISPGAIQRELHHLVEAGIATRTVRGNQVYFQANRKCPVFGELRGIVAKTVGIVDTLRKALAPIGNRIQAAFVYGSIAHAAEISGSNVDVLIIGRVTFAEAVEALAPAQEELGREINPMVLPPAEYRAKISRGNHFLKSVAREKKLFLIGGEDELARLAKKRLGH